MNKKPTYEELEKAFREAVRICEYCDYSFHVVDFGIVGVPERFDNLIERLDAHAVNAQVLVKEMQQERLDTAASDKLTKDQALEKYVAALCKAVEGFLDAGFSMEELSEADAMAIAKVGLIYKKRVEGDG